MKKFLKRFYLGIVLVFLYVPIVVLIIQSFNAGKSRAKWEGFSLRWYGELLQDTRIMNALYITLSIAVLAMIAATILGTLAAIGIYSMKKRPQTLMLTLTNLPNTMPDIVTGISLMLLFIFTKVERGYVTMLLAHITFDTDPIGSAEAQADEQAHLRGGPGPGRDAHLRPDPCDHTPVQGRHHHRGHAGLHPLH